jgi:hypothetical protein
MVRPNKLESLSFLFFYDYFFGVSPRSYRYRGVPDRRVSDRGVPDRGVPDRGVPERKLLKSGRLR